MSDEWSQPAGQWPSNEPAVPATVEVETPANVQMTQEEKNNLIKSWLNIKGQLDSVKTTEADVRVVVAEALFPTPKKGTQRYISPEGFGAIKLVHGWTFTLGDKDAVDPSTGTKVPIKDQVDAVLVQIEAMSERAKLLADRLVKWKPELSVTEYELLASLEDDEAIAIKTLIDGILTVKPAAPQLTFEPPKAG